MPAEKSTRRTSSAAAAAATSQTPRCSRGLSVCRRVPVDRRSPRASGSRLIISCSQELTARTGTAAWRQQRPARRRQTQDRGPVWLIQPTMWTTIYRTDDASVLGHSAPVSWDASTSDEEHISVRRRTKPYNFSVSSGTNLNKSPTRPKSATWKIGASSSLLIATINLESFIPARCWIAPEMPIAK